MHLIPTLLYHRIDEIGFGMGNSFLSVFFIYSKSIFWLEKPNITITQWFNTEIWNYHLDYRVQAGVSIFLPNDFYLNFGLLGFVFGLFILGFILARLSVYLHVFQDISRPICFFYIFLLSRFFCIIWEGGFAGTFSGWLKVIIFYIIFFQILWLFQKIRLK